METKKSSRERLIEASGYLFRTRGYHNTSIADIAEACNLRKASIYHHITSKKELGIEVLTSLTDFFNKTYFEQAYDDTQSEQDRLKEMVLSLEKLFLNRDGGCLMGNLTLEVIDFIPEFQELIQQFFNKWTNAVAHLLVKKYGREEAQDIALDAVASTQGAIMFYRLYKTPTPLVKLRQRMFALLDIPDNVVLDAKTHHENIHA